MNRLRPKRACDLPAIDSPPFDAAADRRAEALELGELALNHYTGPGDLPHDHPVPALKRRRRMARGTRGG